MNLYLITADPELARQAVLAGVDRIFVDLETHGKAVRPGHRETDVSRHSLQDLRAIRSVVPAGALLVRVNPWGQGSEQEIEEVLGAGADIIMLPMFTSVNQVQSFTQCVDGRALTIGLIETPQSLARIASILNSGGLDEVYFGLHDLHLAMGLDYLFEVLSGGFLEIAARQCTHANIKFGIGGVAQTSDGELSAKLILGEHERLGSSGVIISCALTDLERPLSDITSSFDLRFEVSQIRNCLDQLSERTDAQRESDREALVNRVAILVEKQIHPAKPKTKSASVKMEQLLSRPPITADLSAARTYIEGETVLITGGGGSIGSEIARQLIPLNPAKIVLAGKGENSIFEACQDLQHLGFHNVEAAIVDVQNRAGIERIFEKYQPSVVYHAAANKHVHFLEDAPIQAVQNNVFGTLNVAKVSIDHGVKQFVFMSSDKAVNPRNIMGASKRAAEMILLSMAETSETKFAAIRFGNVLGSRGSLVPILEKQIASGGPITITDERMTRYFMTISEAAQLVILAGANVERSDIFVVDMGEPIRILGVVNRLLDLLGLQPGRDIELKVIGARSGEQLHEELNWRREDVDLTTTPQLLRLKSTQSCEFSTIRARIEALHKSCDAHRESEVRELLMKFVGQS